MSEANVSESTNVSADTPTVEGETKERKDRPAETVTMEAFITAWVEVAKGNAPSVKKVATRLDMAPASVSQKATLYRKTHGIALPIMPRGGFDVDAGKALLASLLNPVAEGEGEGEAAPADEAEKTDTPQS